MTVHDIRDILRSAFSPRVHHSDELRVAIEEKKAAGDRLLIVGASITAAIDGHNDVYRSVIEATERAGVFK